MSNEELIKSLEKYDIEVNRLFKENKELKKQKKSVIDFIEYSLNNPFADERNILYLVLRKLKGEEND